MALAAGAQVVHGRAGPLFHFENFVSLPFGGLGFRLGIDQEGRIQQ